MKCKICGLAQATTLSTFMRSTGLHQVLTCSACQTTRNVELPKDVHAVAHELCSWGGMTVEQALPLRGLYPFGAWGKEFAPLNIPPEWAGDREKTNPAFPGWSLFVNNMGGHASAHYEDGPAREQSFQVVCVSFDTVYGLKVGSFTRYAVGLCSCCGMPNNEEMCQYCGCA